MTRLEKVEKLATIVGVPVALISLVFLIVDIRNDTRAMQLQQRAWVGVAQWEVDKEPEDGSSITVRTTVINKGLTPALNVKIKARLSVLAAPIATDWDAVPGEERATMFPEAAGQGFDKSVAIPTGATAAYKAGHLRIWITGRITYEDVFGRPHWTNFCAYHAPDQNLAKFSLCAAGNDVDQEER